jgi:DNA-directed RNA polymerase specialized sigma24 family protein
MNFPTTHWSVLAKATLHGEADARAALELLCQRYWGPVHQFIRFTGFSDAEAQDLTQEFLIHVLDKSIFARADRLQGRFRSFLLGALVRFLGDAADRKKALKRGGNVPHISFDSADVEGDVEDLSSRGANVTVFDREWAMTILETALNLLRADYVARRREADFTVWKNFLPGGSEASSYESAAAQLGVSLPAFKSEVHRLRRRLRALVREEVARTVSAPHEIESEMAHLQKVLMDRGSEFGADNETFSS